VPADKFAALLQTGGGILHPAPQASAGAAS
jgi:hypothetical protein